MPSSPEPANAGELLESYTRSFNPVMAASRRNSFFISSFSFNHGNQLDLNKMKFGYGVVLNYQNEFQYYDDTEVSLYFKDDDPNVTDLMLR